MRVKWKNVSIALGVIVAISLFLMIPKSSISLNEKSKSDVSITVINNTGEEHIKTCILAKENGEILEEFEQITSKKTIVFDNFENKITSNYFKVILITSSDYKYEQSFMATTVGNTNVNITAEDYVKESGGLIKAVKNYFRSTSPYITVMIGADEMKFKRCELRRSDDTLSEVIEGAKVKEGKIILRNLMVRKLFAMVQG